MGRSTRDTTLHPVGLVEPNFVDGTGTLTRGLELLRLLNEAYPARVSELHAMTGMHKATISRLLRTLREAGYVTQSTVDQRYSPTAKARLLGAGVPMDGWITDIAASVMDELAREIQWPSDLATFEGRGMTIRHTTRRTAPIEIGAPINVSNLPMLESDFGRAFLAFASDEQRERVLYSLLRSDRVTDAAVNDRPAVDELLATIRSRGYATRSPSFTSWRASTIAVAVVVEGRAVAGLNVICRTRFLKESEIPKRMLVPLQSAADRMARALCFERGLVTPRR